MDFATFATIAGIVVLLVLSALFSGSETAFTAASNAFVSRRAKEGSKNAKRLARLRDDKDRFIAALLVGNNFVNTTATALASGLLIGWFGEQGVVYASLVMTVVLVIFAEVLPKTYAIQRADETALRAAPFLSLTMRLVGPIGAAVNWVLRIVFRLFGIQPAVVRTGQTEEELQGLIDIYGTDEIAEARAVAIEERQMLRGVLALDDMTLDEVMTQRSRIVGLPAEASARELLSILSKSRHSRMPIWDGGDEVGGIVDARAALRALEAAGWDSERIDLKASAMQVVYVPETRSLREQLHSFRLSPNKMALVVDEYGALTGLVTLDDILEVIVGQIAERGEQIIADPDDSGVVVVRGDTRLREINRALDWDLPQDEISTIGGLAVRREKGLPAVGGRIEIGDYVLTILERHGLRIDSIEIRRTRPREVAED
jgi:Mg2+/Co2+ transporter CorB